MRARVRLAGDNDAVLATGSVPGVSDVCRRGPVARYVWQVGDRAASRWIVPFGSSGRADDPHFLDQSAHWAAGDLIPLEGDPTMAVVVYEEDLPGMGRLSLTVLNPKTDAELVHGWVTQPRATYWGMLDHSVEQVREIYELVDGLPTHHAFLIRLDDRPIGLFQSYEPDADPVGERYDVRSGDVGMHLLLAPGQQPPRGLTGAVVPALIRFLFRDPEARRLVVEPDVRNERALNRLKITGFTFESEIDMPTKRAQLAFLTRERFTALFGDHAAARRTGPPAP
nr:GNAT family N-acetyltransferase [Streptosporangium pseudovulgare]